MAREAKRGKKAIPDRRDQKEKEATTLVARASPVLKVHRDLQGQRAKKAPRVHRVSLVLKAREASLVARAYPVLKVHKDLQGQRVIPADLTRLQWLDDLISDWKSDWLRQGKELLYRPKDRMSPI